MTGGPTPVTELGLSGKTEADGLAVGTASKLVYDTVKELVSGEITVVDELLQPIRTCCSIAKGYS